MVRQQIKIRRQPPRKIQQLPPQPRSNDFWSVMEEAGRSLELMGDDAQNLV